MARPVWAGVLSFGLVSLPVGLYTATDSHTIHFHQLQRGTSDRVRNKRVNERTGEEVPFEDIVKGFDDGDAYVLVEPEELDEIAPGRSGSLDIEGFVDLAEVDPIFFDATYYLAPKGKEYGKIYSLVEQALAKAEKAGIARFVMRSHEYLVAVKAENGLLTCHTLHWADEIRDPRAEIDSLPRRAKAGQKELRMAEQLVEALSMEWKPEDFHDTFREKVAALIKAKRAGESVEKAEPAAESTNVVDLAEALRASVERAAGAGAGGRRGQPPKRPQERARGTAGAKDPQSMTKAELYEKAAAAGIRGRSGMTRDELRDAVTASETAPAAASGTASDAAPGRRSRKAA
ncbi:Ku protein [Streptomyces sp. NPDC058401]|uniref:non-homologous end joining protein Ku n=1 Tax=Streptomyces sp. NPDC058401 TaxID=3346480 RepID=UPI00366143DD